MVCWILCSGVVLAQTSPVSSAPSADAYSAQPALIQQGQQLFERHCSACHNFQQKGIGPSLERVTTEVPATWLRRFIRNAPEQLARGDARTTRLYKEYKQIMPSFASLTDAELKSLLAYLNANRTKKFPANEQVADGLKDPIPTHIAQSQLLLHVEHYATAPASGTAAPLARINKMAVLPDQPERAFVVDLQGKLYEVGQNNWKVALDMKQQRANFIPAPGMGTGFGSFAFHPDFYQNGLLYTTHAEKARSAKADFAYADSIKVTLQWVLTEWKITDPTTSPFVGSSRELMRINMVSPIHGVQEIAFNPVARKGEPDYGLLYIGVGDGGSTEHGQADLCGNKRKSWGTVLRIDPLARNSQNGQYGIPPTNPYAADQDPAVVREIFALGFRNPNRLSWTPDAKLLVTDIGQAQVEELNWVVAGANYGWPNREGTFRLNPRKRMDQVYGLSDQEAGTEYTYPVVQYDHDEGRAISGGFVYAGSAITPLAGHYLFSDLNNGRLFLVDPARLRLGQQAVFDELGLMVDGKPTTFQTISGKAKPDVRWGQGSNKELFILTKSDGKIYRVTGATQRN